MRTPREEQLLAQLRLMERSAALRMLRLLQRARRQLIMAFLDIPTEAAETEALITMTLAIGRTTTEFIIGMAEAMADLRQAAARLGIEIALRELPPSEALVQFGISPTVLQAIGAYHADLVQRIGDGLRQRITETVQVGMLAGQTPVELAEALSSTGIEAIRPFSTVARRCVTIARTEVNRVCSTAHHDRAVDAATRIPGLRKRWVTAHDWRVRPSHARADGQEVGVNEDFVVGGYRCAHPHDPRLPASESVNCRCRYRIVVPEEAEA